MTNPRSKAGPLFVLLNLGAALVTATCVLLRYGFNDEGLGEVIAYLTPIGMGYFILAFIARPLHDAFHNRVTSWLLVNRRYVGLSFAAWHLPHWPVIVGFVVVLGPSTFWEYFGDFFLPAIAVLSVITLLAATSTDWAQRKLGMKTWSAIHTVGIYAIWVWAMQIYLSRIPAEPETGNPGPGIHDYVFLWLLLGALAFRWLMLAVRLWKRNTSQPKPVT
ncbi:hypothetical protein BH11MYX1_BH11MYX1_01280 [soil metagenome]